MSQRWVRKEGGAPPSPKQAFYLEVDQAGSPMQVIFECFRLHAAPPAPDLEGEVLQPGVQQGRQSGQRPKAGQVSDLQASQVLHMTCEVLHEACGIPEVVG